MEAKHAKIGIETSYEDSEEIDVEFPWADDLGGNKYQLKNFPFYAYGISYDDIVEADLKYSDDPYPYMIRVLEKFGHKTLRIILEESIKESEHSNKILKEISEMGCGYEGTNGEKYFVINVQPHCDFWSVCNYLTEKEINWEHADPKWEELYPDENT